MLCNPYRDYFIRKLRLKSMLDITYYLFEDNGLLESVKTHDKITNVDTTENRL